MDMGKNNQTLVNMKKIIIVILVSVILVSMTSCTKEEVEEKDPVNNTLFTDDFFEDVVEIGDLGVGKFVTGDQMEPVIRYLKSLYLVETDYIVKKVNEKGEVLYGPVYIYFKKKDGSQLTITRNSRVFSNPYGDGVSYEVPEEYPSIGIGLDIAFDFAVDD